MISIFNGKSRGIGQAQQSAVYLQVSVALRDHLHRFKGARLGIFLAIALHSDEHGRASPSVDLLHRETGYNKETIAKALTALCELTIDGARVLLAIQERRSGGTFEKNEYLVFPSPAEVAQYEAANVVRKARTPNAPSTEKPDTVQPSTEKPSSVEPCPVKAYGSITILKNNHGGGGDAPPRKKTQPEHVRYLLDQGMGAAEEFRDLDPQTAITDFTNRRAAGQTIAMIVRAWRSSRPEKDQPYVEPEKPARPAANRARPGATAGPVERGTFTTDRSLLRGGAARPAGDHPHMPQMRTGPGAQANDPERKRPDA